MVLMMQDAILGGPPPGWAGNFINFGPELRVESCQGEPGLAWTEGLVEVRSMISVICTLISRLSFITNIKFLRPALLSIRLGDTGFYFDFNKGKN